MGVYWAWLQGHNRCPLLSRNVVRCEPKTLPTAKSGGKSFQSREHPRGLFRPPGPNQLAPK